MPPKAQSNQQSAVCVPSTIESSANNAVQEIHGPPNPPPHIDTSFHAKKETFQCDGAHPTTTINHPSLVTITPKDIGMVFDEKLEQWVDFDRAVDAVEFSDNENQLLDVSVHEDAGSNDGQILFDTLNAASPPAHHSRQFKNVGVASSIQPFSTTNVDHQSAVPLAPALSLEDANEYEIEIQSDLELEEGTNSHAERVFSTTCQHRSRNLFPLSTSLISISTSEIPLLTSKTPLSTSKTPPTATSPHSLDKSPIKSCDAQNQSVTTIHDPDMDATVNATTVLQSLGVAMRSLQQCTAINGFLHKKYFLTS